MNYTDYLSKLLQQKEMSIKELSKHIGCTYDTLTRNARRNALITMPGVLLVRICYAFDMSLDEFHRATQLSEDLGPLSPRELLLIAEIRTKFPPEEFKSLGKLGPEDVFLIMQYRKNPQFEAAIKKLLDIEM